MIAAWSALVASIPSPSSNSIHIGPLQLRAYGLMIALGVVAAVWLWGRRLEANAIGTRDDAAAIAMWAVPAGVIGARLYHVATDWQLFSDDPAKIVRIWEGGLGIPGGVLLGALVGVWATRRRGLATGAVAWAAAPTIALAQSIGRWGNWFNQELFGRSTTLPWGLEIDPAKMPVGDAPDTLYHPTFLYESIWNLGLCVVLVVVGRRMLAHRPWRLLVLYALGYGVGRFWIEGLRIDPAKEAGGWRLNQWMAVVVIALSLLYLVVDLARYGRAPRSAETANELPEGASRSPEGAQPLGEQLGNDGVEELAGSDLGGGDEPGHAGTAPRGDDLDVEPGV